MDIFIPYFHTLEIKVRVKAETQKLFHDALRSLEFESKFWVKEKKKQNTLTASEIPYWVGTTFNLLHYR